MSNCPTCSSNGAPGDPANQIPQTPFGDTQQGGVTYNEGEGTKGMVKITGPMSELITEQLNIIFKRTPLTLGSNPPGADDVVDPTGINAQERQTPAKETIVQDAALREVFSEMAEQPTHQVVLHGIDIQDIKDHVRRMSAGDPKNSDLMGVHEINVLGGDIDDLLNGKEMSAYDLDDTTDVILVTRPIVGDNEGGEESPVMVRRGGANPITQVLAAPVRTVMADGDYETVTQKVEALQRVYEDKVVHASIEAFAISVLKRLAK